MAHAEKKGNKTLEVARAGLFLSGTGNSILAAILLYIVLGDMKALFGDIVGLIIVASVSIALGVSFTLGEYLVHVGKVFKDTDKWHVWAGKFAVLLLFAAINWGGGFLRAQQNVQEERSKASIGAASLNPRYKALLAEKKYIESNVLSDGKVGNDQRAMDRSAEIDASLKQIEDQARQEIADHKDSFAARSVLSLVFIVVNIVFGICATVTASESEPQPQVKAQLQPAKGRNVAQKRDDLPPQVAPQPAIGFHSQTQLGSETERSILRLWDGGEKNQAEIARKVDRSRTHVLNTLKKYKRK